MLLIILYIGLVIGDLVPLLLEPLLSPLLFFISLRAWKNNFPHSAIAARLTVVRTAVDAPLSPACGRNRQNQVGAQSGYSIGIRTMGICGNLILLDKSVAPNTFLDYSAAPTKCSIDLGRAESLLGHQQKRRISS